MTASFSIAAPAPAWGAVLFICGTLTIMALVSAVPAAAQTVDATALSQSSKQPKPVDIEADQMEILDQDKRAVFTGNVDAVRDDVTLKSDKLVADYVETAKEGGGKDTEVTFLEATGNVVIVTARQRITGAWAKMDVKANQVTIGGDVVVHQGQTVLRGQQLFVDLDKNTSQLTGGRVKGSFVPSQ